MNCDPREFEQLFEISGYDGYIGSSDATRVEILKCASWATICHLDHKLNIPPRTYNTTISHSRPNLGTTFEHPATWNNKKNLLYNELISGVHNGILVDKYEFKLYEHDDTGNIIEVRYQGVWCMVDNGYISWSCTIQPLNSAVSYKDIRFSQYLESMRNDVECIFSVLKGRFGILRYGNIL